MQMQLHQTVPYKHSNTALEQAVPSLQVSPHSDTRHQAPSAWRHKKKRVWVPTLQIEKFRRLARMAKRLRLVRPQSQFHKPLLSYVGAG